MRRALSEANPLPHKQTCFNSAALLITLRLPGFLLLLPLTIPVQVRRVDAHGLDGTSTNGSQHASLTASLEILRSSIQTTAPCLSLTRRGQIRARPNLHLHFALSMSQCHIDDQDFTVAEVRQPAVRSCALVNLALQVP